MASEKVYEKKLKGFCSWWFSYWSGFKSYGAI